MACIKFERPTKLKRYCLAAFLLLLAGWLLVHYVIYPNYQYQQYQKEREVFWDLAYSNDFQMIYAANPEVENSAEDSYTLAIINNLKHYSRIEFAMELPPPEQRERGVIYIAPDPSGKTQERLDYFNSLLARYDSPVEESGIGFPLTVDDLVSEHKAVMSIGDNLYLRTSDIGLMNESEWQRERDLLYAVIFSMQAAGNKDDAESVQRNSQSIEKDSYVAFISASKNHQIMFVATPPADSEMAACSFYLYPHEDGHTETLIANLNGIIAEQPGLMDGTGLAAPLTLDNILNDREQVWKIIHRLDSGQMARFRTH